MCSLGTLLQLGCKKSTDTVCLSSSFYIPNSFEQNGDGINDTFGAKGTDVSNYQMDIYDQQSTHLFHSSDLSLQWDGRMQGNSNDICPEGLYLYKISVTDACGTQHTYVGNVMLVK
jgi:gliding motility-associated-like protein